MAGRAGAPSRHHISLYAHNSFHPALPAGGRIESGDNEFLRIRPVRPARAIRAGPGLRISEMIRLHGSPPDPKRLSARLWISDSFRDLGSGPCRVPKSGRGPSATRCSEVWLLPCERCCGGSSAPSHGRLGSRVIWPVPGLPIFCEKDRTIANFPKFARRDVVANMAAQGPAVEDRVARDWGIP